MFILSPSNYPMPLSLSPNDFYNRFTPSEQIALSNAILSNAELHRWSLMVSLSENVDTSNAIVITAVNTLATIGVISADRVSTILAK